jgi:uroporphyrinogen decarboxylase
MNARDRQLSAIRHQTPDRIPVDAIAVEIQDEIARTLDIDPDQVLQALGIDGRIVSAAYVGPVSDPVDGEPYTQWGTPSIAHYGTVRAYPLAGVDTPAQVERYAWPDPALYDYAAAAELARNLGVEVAVRGPYWHPLFCRVCDLVGMDEAMVMMALSPGLYEAILDRVFVHELDHCRRLLAACGDAMPILCLGDDFATQRGMMISPAQWRRFLKPRYAQLFEIGKQAGKHVWFHSCGDITAVLPDLIDIGMDVWETVQLHTLPLSAQDLKREYGKQITFFGGVNTQRLPFATPDEIRSEVSERIEVLGKGGGYICGPDHHVKPDVPPENAIALFEAARSFRRDGYTH